MEKNENLGSLLKEWQEYERNRLGEKFVYFLNDGFINEEDWNNQLGVKICYFLKEGYTDNYNNANHVLDWIRNDGPMYMWRKLCIWTEAIQQAHAFDSVEYDSQEIKTYEKKLISQIAFINIKKSNGISYSDSDELMELAEDKQTTEYLKRELEIINPDVIVCGNTFKYLQKILGDEIIGDKPNEKYFAFWKDKIIINYYHPSARTSQIVNFYALSAIYKAAFNKLEYRI